MLPFGTGENLKSLTTNISSWLSWQSEACLRTFLENILLDTTNEKFSLIKVISGNEKRSCKKYGVIIENVKNIVNNFKTDAIISYLDLQPCIPVRSLLCLLYSLFICICQYILKKRISKTRSLRALITIRSKILGNFYQNWLLWDLVSWHLVK